MFLGYIKSTLTKNTQYLTIISCCTILRLPEREVQRKNLLLNSGILKGTAFVVIILKLHESFELRLKIGLKLIRLSEISDGIQNNLIFLYLTTRTENHEANTRI